LEAPLCSAWSKSVFIEGKSPGERWIWAQERLVESSAKIPMANPKALIEGAA